MISAGDIIHSARSGRDYRVVSILPPELGRSLRYLTEFQTADGGLAKAVFTGQALERMMARKRASNARPTAPTGSDMALLKNRKWKTSYTKRVVDDLEPWRGDPRIDTARELLMQYHRDLHLPYEQRDYQLKLNTALNKDLTRATNRVKELSAANRYLLGELSRMKTWREDSSPKKFKWNIYREPAAPQNGEPMQQSWAPMKQTYVACRHYPNAIHNFFSEQTACEFCMKDGK